MIKRKRFVLSIGASRRLILLHTVVLLIGMSHTAAARDEVPLVYPEQITVEQLPDVAPSSWMFIRDVNFMNLVSGAVQVIDAADGEFKGLITTGSAAGFAISPDNTMLYVSEGFYSRGTRGDYEEMVTFYDVTNLSPVAEVVIEIKL